MLWAHAALMVATLERRLDIDASILRGNAVEAKAAGDAAVGALLLPAETEDPA
jgi:hypothetical protein